tara:strand:- start:391 stop:1872 length:1482 start_codon:yes stop_codon:yes gene_type:complete
MSAFTKCFRPVSSYPSDFADLAVWLRADSGVTFDIPTKRVSAWSDSSGTNNNMAQSTAANQPLREGYGGQNDKAYFSFDGTNDSMLSDSNSPINTDFTIFTVAQSEPVTPPFTNTYSTTFEGSPDVVDCGNPAGGSGGQLFSFTDGANNDKPFSLSVWANIDPTQPWRGWIEKLESFQAEYSFRPTYSNGHLTFFLYDNVGGGYISQRVTLLQQKGEWALYTATYDGSGVAAGMKIYINGVESQDSAYQGGIYNGMQITTSPLDLGNGNTNGYVGDLDECSIYNKQLSTAEIIEMYNLGNPNDLTTLTTSSASLIGWWRMGDGATFPTIPDASTNSNDATMVGMTADNIRAFAPNSEESTYFSYEFGNAKISLGSSSERIYCNLADSSQSSGEWNARSIWNGDSSKYHIATMKLESSTSNLSLQYNNALIQEGTMASYDNTQTYNAAKFKIGNGTHLGNLEGNLQEVIIYNRALSSTEIAKVTDYLNLKYKIY